MLNYLGYSWIDKGENLTEALKMIQRAVELRPNDGYIVDSLGWAYYRLGDFARATQFLERAIELLPEDPTINDHLGDVYWRERPARRGALSMAPRAAVRPRGRRRRRASRPSSTAASRSRRRR